MLSFMLAQAQSSGPILDSRTAVVSTLDGVTTALVAFVLVGLILPHIVKKPRQFYLIVAAIGLIIMFHMLMLMFQIPAFTVFAAIVIGVMQLAGIGLAVMCTGGLSARDLAGEMIKSYEVLRRGETEKEIIIPIGSGKAGTAAAEEDRVVYTIDTPTQAGGANVPPGPANRGRDGGAIPLDE